MEKGDLLGDMNASVLASGNTGWTLHENKGQTISAKVKDPETFRRIFADPWHRCDDAVQSAAELCSAIGIASIWEYRKLHRVHYDIRLSDMDSV
jgi:hypothetical protein